MARDAVRKPSAGPLPRSSAAAKRPTPVRIAAGSGPKLSRAPNSNTGLNRKRASDHGRLTGDASAIVTSSAHMLKASTVERLESQLAGQAAAARTTPSAPVAGPQ